MGVAAIFDPQFTDLVYEAALVPEMWKNVLDGLASASGSVGTMLHSATDERSNTIYSDSLAPFMSEMSEWFGHNSRSQLLLQLPNAQFHSDADHYSEEHRKKDWLWRDYLYRHGLGYAAATWIKVPNGDNLILSVERSQVRGAFAAREMEDFTTLRPHLARSAMLAARLDRERIATATRVFEAVGMPAAALSANATVLDCNPSFAALDDYIIIGARDRLRMKNPGVHSLLTDALNKATSSSATTNGYSFPIAATGRTPAVAHLIPVRRIARDLFSRAVFFIVITPVSKPEAPSIEVIQGLFDLTAAEARVAHDLASGNDLASIADTHSVSRETVRHHLKKIFSKTGYARQGDFLAAIGSLPKIKEDGTG